MKKISLLRLVTILLAGTLGNPVSARSVVQMGEAGGDADKTLSPYFYIPGATEGAEDLPLESTTADATISGVIAQVRVNQVYRNRGKAPIEAIYVFPGSTRAAVFGMQMTIGERTIVAKINKRETARQLYEQAKQAGQSASLLEQNRPNVFQMNVANIMPGDTIKVALDYTELLIPDAGIYEFMYPAVVGPRYSNKSASGAAPKDRWLSNPFLKQGATAPYTFAVNVKVNAGMDVQDVTSPSHRLEPQFVGKNSFTTQISSNTDPSAGTKDFVLNYRLGGNAIETGLLLTEGEDENFFLLMMQPPKRITKSILPAREYVFILDISGSMHGFPLDTAKGVMRELLADLRPQDRFNVLFFAGSNYLMEPQSVPASKANIDRAIASIDSQVGGGSTEILGALKTALSLKSPDDMSRSFVVVTDGYVSVEPESFDLIQKSLGQANLFAFGIGSSVNRHMIEGMARVGLGEPFIVLGPQDAAQTAKNFREYISSPVLTNIKVSMNGFNAYDVEPKAVPDVFAERPILMFGKYKGAAKGSIRVDGVTGAGVFNDTVSVADYQPSKQNSALAQLWARHRISNLVDFNLVSPNDERVKEVTKLGLAYNLMTEYTSFLAIDSAIRNSTGATQTVKQPLPLPEGVSNYAVGSVATGVPPAQFVPTRREAVKQRSGYSSGTGMSHPAPAAPMLLESEEDSAGDDVDYLSKDDASDEGPSSNVKLPKSETTKKGASASDIESVIYQHLRSEASCKALISSAGGKRIKVRVTIDRHGHVSSVKLLGQTLKTKESSAFEKCLMTEIMKLKIGAGVGVVELEIDPSKI